MEKSWNDRKYAVVSEENPGQRLIFCLKQE